MSDTRELFLDCDDTVIPDRVTCTFLSYPKSGRTWVRLMLYHVLAFKYGAITIRGNLIGAEEDFKYPWFYFTHNPVPIDVKKKLVIIARDVRDVLVSWYFHVTLRRQVKKEGSFLPESYPISDFVRSKKWGVENYINFTLYVDSLNVSDCHLIKYEDLRKDTYAEFSRLLDCLGISVEERIKRSIISATDFDFVRDKIEKQDYKAFYPLPQIKDLDRWLPTDGSNAESHKLRKGKVGGYDQYLSKKDIDWLDGEMLKIPEMWRCA
jgi:hypothetical protein